MKVYAKRPEYNNTIFIITGDHRLIPIVQKDKLCRFHVAVFNFSPMLKKIRKIQIHFFPLGYRAKFAFLFNEQLQV